MTNRAAVQRILDHTVLSLEGIERPALLEILPVLHAAQEEVKREMSAWLRSGRGADTFTAARYRNALGILNAAVRRGDELERTTDNALRRTAKRLGPLSVANMEREWVQFGRVFEGTVQPLALDEAAIIAKGDKLLWPRFASSAKRYAGSIGDGARRQLAISHARSETIDELTNRLYRHMPRVFNYERSSAERLAITESHNAYNEYHQQGIIQAHDEDDQVCQRWEASADGRRCPWCASLDGKIVAVDGEFDAKWTERGIAHAERVPRPPAHPRCRCCIVAWRMSWASYASPDSIATLRRAQEEFGRAA